MTSNPLLQRELRCALRSGRAFLLLGVYVTALAAVVALTYPGGLKFDPAASKLGRQLFLSFGAAQALLVLLVTPALAVAGLCGEREQGALEMLLATPLTRWDIVLAKFLAPLARVILLVTASLPLTAVAFIFGGVSPGEVALTYGVIVSLAAVCAAIGVLHASLSPRSLTAFANTYLSLPLYACVLSLLWLLGLTGASLLFLEIVFAASYFICQRQLARSFCYAAMGCCCFSFLPLIAGWYDRQLTWQVVQGLAFIGAALAIVLGCLGEARRRLEYVGAAAPTVRSRGSWIEWAPIPERWNPVLVFELRHGLLNRHAGRLARLLVAALLVHMLFPLLQVSLAGRYPSFIAMLVTTLVWGVALALGVLLVSREIDRGTVASLRTLPLSDGRIIVGKFLAGAIGAGIALVVLTPLSQLSFSKTAAPLRAMALQFVATGLGCIPALWVGMATACLVGRTQRALMVAFSMLAVLFAHGLHQMESIRYMPVCHGPELFQISEGCHCLSPLTLLRARAETLGFATMGLGYSCDLIVLGAAALTTLSSLLIVRLRFRSMSA